MGGENGMSACPACDGDETVPHIINEYDDKPQHHETYDGQMASAARNLAASGASLTEIAKALDVGLVRAQWYLSWDA